MRGYMIFGVVLGVLLAGMGVSEVIGIERFEYPNGALTGQNGGEYWTWNNISKTHTNGKSAWLSVFGGFTIEGQSLLTSDGGALRDYGANRDDAAFRAAGVVYYSVLFSALNDQGWCGVSGYDFGGERIFFGMPGAQGDVPLGKFGIDAPGHGKWLSSIDVQREKVYHLICAIDFDGDQLRMWVNPDSDDWDNGAADNSADVRGGYGGSNWNTGVRLASGGLCRWDDLMVANTFWDVVPKKAKSPFPANGQRFVPLDVTLSWDPARDPLAPDEPNPAITAHRLYTNFDNPADPNLHFVAEIANTGDRAEYGPLSLLRDKTYSWRIDHVLADANDIVGTTWSFESLLSVPVVTGEPGYQLVWAGDSASFTVTATSLSPMTYQWYRYVDGISDIELVDGGNISGSQLETLSIDDVQLIDEGEYYCVVNNDSGIPATSRRALLAVKRRIAYWPFEDNSPQCVIPGSPSTVVYGTPEFTAGRVGDAMAFDAGLDMLYTDPNDTAYFDVCNYNMTVACWVQTTAAQTWVPFVARHGEDGQGWQLRQGSVAGRPTFTTRGTGNDDGTRGDRTVADGNWHYVVGTFDGSVKKLYIDGVVSRVFSADTGNMLRDGDAVSGTINATVSPVAIAGRVRRLPTELIIEYWNVVAAKYDEVEIYNYALDAEAIAQAYADVTGTAICTNPQAYDLDGDCVVDMSDFARLASEWLNSNLVQPTLQ